MTETAIDNGQVDGPVFVVNVPRSGSTLMQVMLSSHPQVCICPETKVADRIVRKWSPDHVLNARDRKVFRRLLDGDAKLQGWQVPRSAAYELLESSARITPREVIESVFAHYRDSINPGATLCGLKKGSILHEWPAVLNYWPGARFVFTCRDPRASVSSSVARLPGRMLVPEMLKWRRRVQAAERLAASRPEAIMRVRYEEWVMQPEATMTEVCRFLGLAYDDRMIDFQEQNRGYRMIARGMEDFHPNTARGITTDRVAGWKTENARWRTRAVERLLGREMARLGYE